MSHQLGYSRGQLRETWATMEELVSSGLVRSIGLSNIGVHRLKALLAVDDLRVHPSVVQVEHHPYNANHDLLRFCKSVQPLPIHVTAYASLGSNERPSKYQTGQPALLDDPTIQRVAKAHGAAPATVALAWTLRHGVAIIPKSGHTERIVANRRYPLALAHRLTRWEMTTIDALDRNFRYLAAGWLGYAWRPGMSLEELYDDPKPVDHDPSLRMIFGAMLMLLAAAYSAAKFTKRGSGAYDPRAY